MTTDSGSDYSQDRDVVVAKIISGTCLFVISVICGVIPFKLAQIFKWSEPIDVNGNSKRKSAKVVTALLCFGGGVLLATTFLHLLPEVSAEIANLQSMGMIPQMNLHLAELLMMSGFFLIYLIEEIVHYYLHQYQNKVKKSQASLTMKPEDETFAEAFMRGMSARNSIHRRYSNEGLNNNNSHHGSMILSDTNELKNDSKLSTVLETVQMSNNDTFLTVPNNKVITEKTPNINGHIHEHNNHNHHHRHNHHDSHDHGHTHAHGHSHAIPLPHSADEDMFVSSLRGLLIVLALSIHELFEGFAVGLERTSYGVYYMFAAVCGHKFVISFCIGVELMVQRTTLWLAFLYVIVYSIVSAIGIIIGGILTTGSMGDQLQVPNVVLQGFATGTLLYVIFFEVLSKDRSGVLPYVSVLVGFIAMFGLQYISGIFESQNTKDAYASELATTESLFR